MVAQIKQLFGWLVLAIGFVVTAIRWRFAPRRWLSHTVFFVVLQLLLVAGQVFYAGPSSTIEAAHLFRVDIQGGL